ncbi:MAG: hypothetical protein CVU12_05315, partial [Bacteroidetes bacterium HGW-Bacteroidetes-7]
KGLEPPRLSAPDPKSGAATNYAMPAFFEDCKGITKNYSCNSLNDKKSTFLSFLLQSSCQGFY